MSTGFPKEFQQNVRQSADIAVRSSMDMCKGCRSFCRSLISTIGKNRLATAMVVLTPMLVMSGFLLYVELALTDFIYSIRGLNVAVFNYYKNTIFSPAYALAGITYGFGLLAWLSIRFEYQNLLRFCAFVYRGIAHWVLLSIFLLIFPIGGYLPVYMLFQIVAWSVLPASIWLFTAAVMTGHSDLITSAIENRRLTAAAQAAIPSSALDDV